MTLGRLTDLSLAQELKAHDPIVMAHGRLISVSSLLFQKVKFPIDVTDCSPLYSVNYLFRANAN